MFKPVHLPLFCLLLLALASPAAQAQGGCAYVFHDDNLYIYYKFPSSNILKGEGYSGGAFPYRDEDCQTPAFDDDLPFGVFDAVVLANSATRARELCESAFGNPIASVELHLWATNVYECEVEEYRVEPIITLTRIGHVDGIESSQAALAACQAEDPRTNYVTASRDVPGRWWCYLRQVRSSGNGRGGRGSQAFEHPVLPLAGLRLHAFDGMHSGIQFNRLSNYGVGDPAVIEMGFLDAVDVWGNIGRGYSVCFPQAGRIVFLDAATSPRTLMEVDNVIDDGYTCAAMNRAGTMVLVNAPAGTVAQTSTSTTQTTRRPGTDDSIDDAIKLDNCTVTPRVNLRLRSAPWGRILDVIPRGTEVPAKARTKSWFQITYDETEGWSAAWLTDIESECGWA